MIRLAEVHHIGVGIREDEDAVIGEFGIDEVELVGIYFAQEAEVGVSNLVIAKGATCERTEGGTEFWFRHAAVFNL